jgi:hypothetical protein
MFVINAADGRWRMIDLQPSEPLCGFGIMTRNGPFPKMHGRLQTRLGYWRAVVRQRLQSGATVCTLSASARARGGVRSIAIRVPASTAVTPAALTTSRRSAAPA